MKKHKLKLKQMEQCCQELTNIAKVTSDNQHDIKSAIMLLEQKQDSQETKFSSHDDKEDTKNKWVYSELENLKAKYNMLTNRMYLVVGGGGVILLLIKLSDFGITITQGGG